MGRSKVKTILLVEDEAILALSHSGILQKNGYEVQIAYNGESAIETVRKSNTVDLVLMDINLGSGIDGTQAAQEILQIKKLPIVFLTSHSEQAMVEKVKGITRYGYVIKSSQEFVLLETIGTAFELFQARTSMEAEIEAHKKTEAELKARNHFIQTILDNLPLGLSVNYIDQGKATYMNEGFINAYGWSRGVFDDIPTFFQKVYPDPEFRQKISARIMADVQSGDPQRMKWQNILVTHEDGSTGYVTAQNIPIPEQNFMISTARDVTVEYQHFLDLQKSEAQYRALVDSFPNGIIALFDTDLRYTAVGGMGLAKTGISEADFLGKTLRDLYPPEIADRDEPALQAALAGEKRDSLVAYNKGVHRVITGPIYSEDGQVIGGQVMTQDVTNLHQAESKLKSALQKLRMAVDSARLGLWTYSLESGAMESNENLATVLGSDQLAKLKKIEDWREITHPDDRDQIEKIFRQAMAGVSRYNVVWRVLGTSGDIRYLNSSVAPIFVDGQVTELIGTTYDQTELEKTKRQMEMLVKETNHRVKNHLLSILGLVSFTETSKDIDLSEIRSQIDTIRHVHELLLGSEGQDHFDLSTFLQRVIESAAGSLSASKANISTSLESMNLSPAYAVPFGLIVNELVTNAIRHGIQPDPEGGNIHVSCGLQGSVVRLVVENTGQPLSPEFHIEGAHSTGFQLIQGLAHQIEGKVRVETGEKTRFIVEFTPRRHHGH